MRQVVALHSAFAKMTLGEGRKAYLVSNGRDVHKLDIVISYCKIGIRSYKVVMESRMSLLRWCIQTPKPPAPVDFCLTNCVRANAGFCWINI
jgi:hypothetical protein